jgi:predicted enzyme related to lactoylglutathione lyase
VSVASSNSEERSPMIRIDMTSALVDDQEKALRFYTEVLGFITKRDTPLGEYRWLTVVSPAAPDGVELLLEPNENPAGRTFEEAFHSQGIPATIFGADDVQAEYERMTKLGVVFTMAPTRSREVTSAVFDDTCGNLIALHQVDD